MVIGSYVFVSVSLKILTKLNEGRKEGRMVCGFQQIMMSVVLTNF
jgi:hypothetical protein